MLDALRLQLDRDGSMDLVIRVRPNAPRSKFVAPMADGSLKIDIAEAAEGGKANDELVRFLAEAFGVPRSNVDVLAGKTSRRKRVRIRAAGQADSRRP